MLGSIVKVSTYDNMGHIYKKDLHIFPWISNIQRSYTPLPASHMHTRNSLQ